MARKGDYRAMILRLVDDLRTVAMYCSEPDAEGNRTLTVSPEIHKWMLDEATEAEKLLCLRLGSKGHSEVKSKEGISDVVKERLRVVDLDAVRARFLRRIRDAGKR